MSEYGLTPPLGELRSGYLVVLDKDQELPREFYEELSKLVGRHPLGTRRWRKEIFIMDKHRSEAFNELKNLLRQYGANVSVWVSKRMKLGRRLGGGWSRVTLEDVAWGEPSVLLKWRRQILSGLGMLASGIVFLLVCSSPPPNVAVATGSAFAFVGCLGAFFVTTFLEDA